MPKQELSIDKVLDAKGSRVREDLDEGSDIAFVTAQLSGPLPLPGILAGYDKVVPGAADRLVKMLEREQQHRHKMDKDLLNSQIADARDDRAEAKLGQIFALIIGITAICTGGVVAVEGAPLSGGFIGSSGVVGLAAVFITGRKERKAPDDDQGKISEVGE